MTEEEFVEKRKHARLEMNSVVSYRVSDSCNRKAKVPCQNVSLSGVRFLAKEALSERTPLDLDIYLCPEEKAPIVVKGEVVWQAESLEGKDKGYDTGASFCGMADADQKRFASFVFGNLYKMVGLNDWPRGRSQ